jgi:predicted Zn finger-like uncharacterized protein
MEVVCQKCKSKFRIADEKLPSGQNVSVKCAKCESKIEIDPGEGRPVNADKEDLEKVVDEVASSAYDPLERPFDYLEEGIETALLCEHDLGVKQKIRKLLEQMDYHVVEAASARNALKYMRFHVYDLVVVNEAFEATNADSNHVLQYLSQLPIVVRRNMFIVLLGKGLRTTDNMLAFNKSVNLVINLKDMDDMEKILKGALKEHNAFYEVFMESLKKTGRA